MEVIKPEYITMKNCKANSRTRLSVSLATLFLIASCGHSDDRNSEADRQAVRDVNKALIVDRVSLATDRINSGLSAPSSAFGLNFASAQDECNTCWTVEIASEINRSYGFVVPNSTLMVVLEAAPENLRLNVVKSEPASKVIVSADHKRLLNLARTPISSAEQRFHVPLFSDLKIDQTEISSERLEHHSCDFPIVAEVSSSAMNGWASALSKLDSFPSLSYCALVHDNRLLIDTPVWQPPESTN